MSNNVNPIRPQIPEWSFAERVRKVRRDMHLTQEQFADLIGVGLKAYSAWESGKNHPANIIELATTLERITGVDRRWFIGWISDDHSPDGQNGWAPSGSNRRPKEYLGDGIDDDLDEDDTPPPIADLDFERERRRTIMVEVSA